MDILIPKYIELTTTGLSKQKQHRFSSKQKQTDAVASIRFAINHTFAINPIKTPTRSGTHQKTIYYVYAFMYILCSRRMPKGFDSFILRLLHFHGNEVIDSFSARLFAFHLRASFLLQSSMSSASAYTYGSIT